MPRPLSTGKTVINYLESHSELKKNFESKNNSQLHKLRSSCFLCSQFDHLLIYGISNVPISYKCST